MRYPKITFHHILPGLIQTNALENQNFHPQIVSIGRFFAKFIATDPDTYADVPVSKAVTGGSGLFLSQQWGWQVGLEKWAEDATKRKELFEWAIQRAQKAAKTQPETSYQET
jgi:hypothetical protein